MRKLAGFALLLVSLGFSQGNFAINGIVTNQAGAAIQGATVKLVNAAVQTTTGADGSYLLTGTISPVMNPAARYFSSIQYRSGAFIFEVTSQVEVSVKIFNMQGALVSAIVSGRLNQGRTVVPFNLKAHGSLLMMSVRAGSLTAAYQLIGAGMNTYHISSAASPLAKTASLDWLQAEMTGYVPHSQEIQSYEGTINITLIPSSTPDFGPNVFIFDEAMGNSAIQAQVNQIYGAMEDAHFSNDRYAFLFKPGDYSLTVDVGYYTQVYGLGEMPDDVTVTGAVRSISTGGGGTNNVTLEFWKGIENLAINPDGGRNIWAVSQAAPFRRVHVNGSLILHKDGGWASGGFVADSKVEGTGDAGSQQQYFTRNSEYQNWTGGAWNNVFVGITNAPSDNWPSNPNTVVAQAPVVREKPFLYVDGSGNYFVKVPELRVNASGPSWANGPVSGASIPIGQFYIAHESSDNAASLNAALAQGKDLLLTPGVYYLDASLQIDRPNTIVLGIGMPSLIPNNGVTTVKIADVDGVRLCNVILEANFPASATLVEVGPPGSTADHSANPTSLHDVIGRVGGLIDGMAEITVEINSNNVIGDHFWLWRADHGAGSGWNSTPGANAHGLVVNGDNFTMYGLFAEHYQEEQVVWNGNGGKNYFFQCEIPYRPPSGWPAPASYVVSSHVDTHEAWGIGVYAVIRTAGIVLDNAMLAPNKPGINMNHVFARWLDGDGSTSITNVISGTGGTANNTGSRQASVVHYP